MSAMMFCDWHWSYYSKTHRCLIWTLHWQWHTIFWNTLSIDRLFFQMKLFAKNRIIFHWLMTGVLDVSVLATLTTCICHFTRNLWVTNCIHHLELFILVIALLLMRNRAFRNIIMSWVHYVSTFKFSCTLLVTILLDRIVCLLGLVNS